MILLPFPEPPTAILHAFERIAAQQEGKPNAIDLTDSEEILPRPWEPSSCPPRLRREIWTWCEDAAIWVNHEFAWRPGQLIPACWPRHPHIARELAALACQRWMADQAHTPEPVEEWHRHNLPMFCERMTTRLGESRCRDGTHLEWPAQARYAAFISAESVQARRRTFAPDAEAWESRQ
jgi:hypothetical protein